MPPCSCGSSASNRWRGRRGEPIAARGLGECPGGTGELCVQCRFPQPDAGTISPHPMEPPLPVQRLRFDCARDRCCPRQGSAGRLTDQAKKRGQRLLLVAIDQSMVDLLRDSTGLGDNFGVHIIPNPDVALESFQRRGRRPVLWAAYPSAWPSQGRFPRSGRPGKGLSSSLLRQFADLLGAHAGGEPAVIACH